MDEALIVFRAVHFASAMLLFGAAAFRVYGIAGADPGLLPLLDARLRRLLLISAIAALLSALALVPCVAATMAGAAAAALDWHTISAVLFDTGFGRVWRWHLAMAALLVVASMSGRVLASWRVGLAALLLASLGCVGHAAGGRGIIGVGHQANDALHLLAGGLWLGGLVPLAALAIRARHSDDGAWIGLLRRVLPRFSRVAYGAVALVALTGIVNAALLLGGIEDLTQTAYGRLLLIKLSLVLLLLALAVINRLILVPRIGGGERPGSTAAALSWTIAIELATGLAIIAVVGILGTLPPATHAHAH